MRLPIIPNHTSTVFFISRPCTSLYPWQKKKKQDTQMFIIKLPGVEKPDHLDSDELLD